MLRYRRYRVFVAFAVISLLALYRFSSSNASFKDDATIHGKAHKAASSWRPRPQLAHETKKLDIEVPAAKETQSPQRPPPILPVSRPTDTPFPAFPTLPDVQLPTDTVAELFPIETASTSTEKAHWKKQSELFPVPSSKLITLPTGNPEPIAKIQHEFGTESAAERADREEKLGIIKNVFKRSWDGYREYAWLQDELSPVSGKFRNPFASWGATLVDALDTLWIMDMREEFDEAAKAVDKIDFTTSPRPDIPLFETTIRYLGGLLAAYDISGGKYDNLLQKAIELAEVLISAFDTPNRMPITYYYWNPESRGSGNRRAPYRVVLAEIGSLSLEFTRLAQITGEQKYYDAVARITDNLEEFQDNTRLPGMWPAEFDASGCKVIKDDPDESISLSSTLDNSVESPLGAESEPVETTAVSLPPNGKKYKPLDLPSPVVLVAETTASEPPATDSAKFKPLDLPDPVVLIAKTTAEEPAATSVLSRPVERKKRQLDDLEVDEDDVPTTVEVSFSVPPLPSPTGPECEEQGFASSPGTHAEEYTLGGMSDSTYEYLPKEWLLLGGLVPKYRTMYEKSIEVVKKNLLFRPMLPNDTNVLFSGKLIMPRPDIGHPHLEPENAHLTCFAGGMFGMGAKIFDRPGDLEIAKKLTEGCIWSYDMTATGIMPEAFLTVACRSIERCEWNETKYWDEIDPSAQWRFSSYETQIKLYKDQMASASDWYSKQLAAMTAAPTTTAARGSVEARATGSSSASTSPRVEAELESGFQKRQLDQADIEDSEPVLKPQPPNVPGWNAPGQKAPQDAGLVVDSSEPPTPVQVWPYNDADSALEPDSTTPEFPYIYSPTPPMTHEEYVKATIENERLPPGVTSVKAKGYILRPEAIESVWHMYRITGDPKWREAGWRMFQAVEKHTAAKYGNSAIDDVTKPEPELDDAMESFWLAETLKYFYLLFADESVVSLDEWVLNTEAHPFKRPK